MKSGYGPHVEAAKFRSLLARRHVHAGHFGEVLVYGGAGQPKQQPRRSQRRLRIQVGISPAMSPNSHPWLGSGT
jgi:hypothetical protein